MKKFSSWLIYIAAIGLGFFAFVIVAGVLPKLINSRFEGWLSLFIMLFIALLGLVAAYFAFRHSRRFMAKHVFKDARRTSETDDTVSAGDERNKRIAMALFLFGTVLFPVFIFTLLSSIINAYV